MNTNLLKIVLSALACALLVSTSGCGGGSTLPNIPSEMPASTSAPTSIASSDGSWQISDVRVIEAEPTTTIVKTEDFPLPNCGGTGPLKTSLATQKSVEKGITVGDKATIGGTIEVDIPPAVKLKLEAEVEHAYQQTLKDVETRQDMITMEANAGTSVVYVINWEQQTYESNIDFVKGTEVLQTPYTYTLRVPKAGGSHQVDCPSTPPPTASSLATPRPTKTPLPTPTPPPSDTPTPPPLFEDTFTGGMSKSWKVEYGGPIVVNDALTFEQKTLMSVGKKDWTNYIVTLETSHMGCQEAVYDNAVVIGVRYQDANNMIALRWSPCWGAWFKVENGKWNEVPNTRFTLPPLSAGGVRHPEVTANGNLFTVSGGPSFVTDEYPTGKVAIITDPGVIVDNFMVTAQP